MSNNCKNFLDCVWQEIYKGLVAIPKVLLLAIVIAILGVTPVGNLIRCKLFDAEGCKPKMTLSISSISISNCDHDCFEGKYTTIDKKRNLDLSKFVFFEYTVEIKNKGRERIDRMNLRVKPLITSTNYQSRLIGYSITTGRSFNRKAYLDADRGFDIKSHYFDLVPWWWSLVTKERAVLKIAVAYSADSYADAKAEILIIEGECDRCQTPFIKNFLTKGDAIK